MAEQLAEQLHRKVMQRGVHPGHCAVVFDGGAALELFPPQDGGLPAFVQLVNQHLRRIPVNRQASYMLEMSQNIEETLLYSSRSAPSNSFTIPLVVDIEDTAGYHAERHAEVMKFFPIRWKVPYPKKRPQPHSYICSLHKTILQNLTNCKCKTFVGSVAEMKGNEARVVFFLHPVDQLKDGQVSKVKPHKSSLGVDLLLLLGLLVGLGVLVYVLLGLGVQARGQQGLVSTAAEVSSDTTVTEYEKSDKNVTTAVTERTKEFTTNQTRGNDSISETKMPTKARLPGTNQFLAAPTAL